MDKDGIFKFVQAFGLTERNAGEWGVIFTVLGIIVAILLFFFQNLLTFFVWLKAKWTTRKIERDFGSDAFEKVQLLDAISYYIEPDCSQVDPSNEEDLRQVAVVREKVFQSVDRFLASEHSERHLLLLADSGMGKTSFLLNYYERNRRKGARYRHRIAVIPLGRPDVINRIGAIEQKKDTTLFLDAFDEDTEAIRDYQSRLREIMEACVDFRRIVITCRTQFFNSDEEIPKKTGVAIIVPRRAGESREYRFYKLYLLPFTDQQVERYVRNQFAFWQRGKRKAARRMIAAIPELSIRPMLLAVVPDLIKKDRIITELFQLYEFMVESWLERESPWVDKNHLRQFSELLAVNLYINREHRGSERIPRDELLRLKEINASELDNWKLTARSLLNRDAEGNYKFAHRSIMEYLFVVAFLNGCKECLSVKWTDLMKDLFVSWGRTIDVSVLKDELSVLRTADFRKTGLLPLKIQRQEPMALTMETAALGISGRFAGVTKIRLPSMWQNDLLKISRFENKLVLCDFAEDRVWVLPDMKASEMDEGSIYRVGLNDVSSMLSNISRDNFLEHSNWRTPTLDEFDTLFVVDMRMESFLIPTEYYWTSDSIVGGGAIVVSNGHEVFEDERVRHLGFRTVMLKAGKKEGYHIFEIIQKQGRLLRDELFTAQFVIVSTGSAVDTYYDLINCLET